MRRLAAAVAAGAVLALPGGTALAATTQPSVDASAASVAASASGPAASATPTSSAVASGAAASATPAPGPSANPLCTAQVVDAAGVLSGDEVEQLRSAGADLAQTTVLRVRTVSGPDADVTGLEGQLERSCGWVDASSQRLPTLLVVMVDTDTRQVGIFPGPSLAASLTDTVLQAIERDTMRPAFAAARWTAGLQAGVTALDQLVGPNAVPSASFDPSALASAAAAVSGNASSHPSTTPPTGSALASPAASSSSGFPYAIVLGVVAAVVVIGGAVLAYRRVSLRRGFATEAAWDRTPLDEPEEPEEPDPVEDEPGDGEEPTSS